MIRPPSITVRDKPPMNFGGEYSAHGLQFGQAARAADRASPDGPLPLRLEGPGRCCRRGRSLIRTTDRKPPSPETKAR